MRNGDVSRNNNFGILHLAASFFVIYGHQYNLLNQGAPIILGNQIHTLGLKIIFLISGYLITKSLFSMTCDRKKITMIYLVKRFGRLFPELLFCLLITALLIGPLFSTFDFQEYYHYKDSIIFYIKNNILLYPVFNLPGVFVDNPYPGAVNGSLWTMPIEFALYILLLFLMLPFKSNRRAHKIIYAIFSAVIFILWGAKTVFFHDACWIFYGTDWVRSLEIIIYFVVGGGVYIFDLQSKFNIQRCFFLLIFLCTFRFNTVFIGEIICMIALTCCVFALGLAEKQSLNLACIHPECAYGVYLWGFPVQQCLIKAFVMTGKIQSINFLFIVSALTAYIFARISYNLIYKPFKRINNRILEAIESHFKNEGAEKL